MIELGDLELTDLGPLKKVELCLRRQGLVLLRGENRDTTAADSNGVGKSWVIKGLEWCWFGDTTDDERTDEVIRRGTMKATARTTIHEPSGKVWDIIRTRTKSGGKLEIKEDGLPCTGAIMKDSQASINRILGMDFQTFRNTVVFGQGDVARFAAYKASESERKSVLKNILRATVVDKAAKHISEKARLAEMRKQTLQRLVEIAKARQPGLSTEHLDNEIKTLKERKATASKEFKNINHLNKLVAEVTELLASYAAKRTSLVAEKAKRQALLNDGIKLKGELHAEQYKASETAKQLGLFKDGKCPLCTTPASGTHVKQHLAALNNKAAAVATQIARLEAESKQKADAAAACTADIQALESEVADEQQWKDRLTELSGDLRAIEQAKETVAQVETDLVNKQAQRSGAIKSLKALNGEIKQHETELEAIEDELLHYSFWQRGFGNQGLPSYVIDTVVPELNLKSNFWLNILTDGDIQLEFDTQSKLKSGELRDKFAMKLSIEGVEGTRPSSGQGQKIMIATSLGLADVVAEQENATLDLMCLDEILDGLDSKGKARIADLLVELRKKRSTILVVSHDSEVTQMFEKVITLVKDGGATMVA